MFISEFTFLRTSGRKKSLEICQEITISRGR
jgi:hypothetical protein